MSNNIILTGDRPTGSLHLGHYVGSLRKRVELQNTGKFDQFVMIADLQALTDNADNPEKIKQHSSFSHISQHFMSFQCTIQTSLQCQDLKETLLSSLR